MREYDAITIADGEAALDRLIARARLADGTYQFLVKIDGRRRGAAPAHRVTDAGEPLCGAAIVGDDWTLARSPRPGQRICSACEAAARALAPAESSTQWQIPATTRA